MSGKFIDCSLNSLTINSTWKNKLTKLNSKSISCQTTIDIYQFKENETQSGLYTEIIQNQVLKENKDLTLLEHFNKINIKKNKKRLIEQWNNSINDGHVTIDGEVVYDPNARLDIDYFIEYVHEKINISTQTMSNIDCKNIIINTSFSNTSSSSNNSNNNRRRINDNDSNNNESKNDNDGHDVDDIEESKSSRNKNNTDVIKNTYNVENDQKLFKFLQYMEPMICTILNQSASKDVFKDFDFNSIPNYNNRSNNGIDSDQSAIYWKCLTVDLEKHKVIFPDWNLAKYYNGNYYYLYHYYNYFFCYYYYHYYYYYYYYHNYYYYYYYNYYYYYYNYFYCLYFF
jgi:hypothetical protein